MKTKLTPREELASIIEFATDDRPPNPSGLNPFKRIKQSIDLQEWVERRERENPSAGITIADVEKKYQPIEGKGRLVAGAITGGAIGALGSVGAQIALRKKLPKTMAVINALPPHVSIGIPAALGASAGAYAGNYEVMKDLSRRNKEARRVFKEAFENDSVDARTLKAHAPIATSYGEVVRGLKDQDVGFLTRHANALGTYGMRHGHNAAFLPLGEKGLIVSPKKVPKAVIQHESGHAKDYAHGGGEGTFERRYPRYGTHGPQTMLAEERAWKLAGRLSKKDAELRRRALDAYAAANLYKEVGMSAREELQSIIELSGYQYAPVATGRRPDGTIAYMQIRQSKKKGFGPWMARNSGMLTGSVAGAGAGIGAGVIASKWLPKHAKLATIGASAIGAGAGGLIGRAIDQKRKRAEALKVANYAMARSILHNRAIQARNEQQTANLSAREELDSIISFAAIPQITYNDVQQQIHSRKARVHREKSNEYLGAAGFAAGAGAIVENTPAIQQWLTRTAGATGNTIKERLRFIPGAEKLGGSIVRNPSGAARKAVWALPVALGGAALAHRVAGWSNDAKANKAQEMAQEIRRRRYEASRNGTQKY